MARAHTVAVAVAIALIPLMPVVLWVYAHAVSVDRGPVVARNERVFRSAPPLPGARRIATYSYPVSRWGVSGSLVPIDGYRTEFFLRLPRKVPLQTIEAHYERMLRGWRERRSRIGIDFTRAGVLVEIAVDEASQGAKRFKAYAVYVSQ